MTSCTHEKSAVWKNAAGWNSIGFSDKGIRFFEFGFGSGAEAGKAAEDFDREQVPLDRAPGFVRTAAGAIDRYFMGENINFNNIPLDWTGGTVFRRAVWSATMKIPYGETRSYGETAQAAGCPGAARAVGTALGANPMPVIVPCHRVLHSGGGLGGFASGLAVKKALLALEKGARVDFRNIAFER